MADKVLYGLKNVYVASVTQSGSTVTFGTPYAIPGAVNMSLEADGDENVFYADNTKYYVATANNGYTGSLEVALLPEQFKTDFLGMAYDTAGNLIERATDKQRYFAMLFEFEGDVKGKRWALYYCKASRPNVEGATTEDSIEPGTSTLEFSALPLPDGSAIIKGESTASTSTTAYSNWFSTVTKPVISA